MSSAGENLKKMEFSCTYGGNVKWHIYFEKYLVIFFKVSRDIYLPKRNEAKPYEDLYINIHSSTAIHCRMSRDTLNIHCILLRENTQRSEKDIHQFRLTTTSEGGRRRNGVRILLYLLTCIPVKDRKPSETNVVNYINVVKFRW